MNLVNRKPIYVGNIRIKLDIFFYLLLDLLIKNFTFFTLMAFGKSSHNSKPIFSGHRKKCGEIISPQIYDESIMRKFPIDRDVRNIKKSFDSAAKKINAERVPNNTLRAVARDQKLRFASLYLIVTGGHHGGNTVFALR